MNQTIDQKIIQQLADARSATGGTSLITYYIPGDTSI